MSVGLDIGTKSIKIVELEKNGNAWQLMGSGVVGYKGKSIEEAEDEKALGEIAEIIKKLHKETRMSRKELTLSLPEQQVFTRTIRFPLLTDQEIASAVKWEAEQYVPIPVSEAIVQHKIIERRDKDTPPAVVVLLVAAPQALVEKYMYTVGLAGLSVVAVESELVAMCRSLSPAEGTSIVIDFGARTTDIAITRNANLVFSRSVPTSGDALTRSVAQNLGVEILQAEEYKKTYGLSTTQLEGKVKQALDPVIKVVVDEIKKAVHFYQTEEKAEPPRSIIITGGTAGLPDLIPVLSRELTMEVVMGNPFTNIRMGTEAAKSLANYAPLYSIAVGLALRGGA